MKGRCGNCGRTRDTRQCFGHAQGNYRRAGRRIPRRVCEECCRERLASALKQQSRGLGSPLNENAFEWEQAVRGFGIPIPPGTLLDRMAGRVEP